MRSIKSQGLRQARETHHSAPQEVFPLRAQISGMAFVVPLAERTLMWEQRGKLDAGEGVPRRRASVCFAVGFSELGLGGLSNALKRLAVHSFGPNVILVSGSYKP